MYGYFVSHNYKAIFNAIIIFCLFGNKQTNKTDRSTLKKTRFTSNITMDANKSFEIVLDQVKSSKLNFHIIQSPFSATISLKKSFIKDKSGWPFPKDPNFLPYLKAENQP